MIILTSSTKATHKAQICISRDSGLEPIYTATCTKSELCAAKSVVRKWFGNSPAESVRRANPDEVKQLCGDFFTDPQRKQVFQVWIFNPQAR